MKPLVRVLAATWMLSVFHGSAFLPNVASAQAPLPLERIAVDDGTITVGPDLHGRFYAASAYDAVHQRVFLFGGFYGENPRGLQDVWVRSLSGGHWTPVQVSGVAPAGRASPAMIYDPVRDRLIVFGGYGDFPLNDVWALSLSGTPAWSQLTPTGTPPSPRSAMGAIYDPPRDRLVVFGGDNGGSPNDVFALTLGASPDWSQLSVAGLPPAGRSYPAGIYDPVRDRAVFCGGYGSNTIYTDAWALSLDSPTWSPILTSGNLPSASSGIYDPPRDRLVVMDSFSSMDVWALNFTGPPLWQKLPSSGTPDLRMAATIFPDPVADRMLLFGGYGQPYYSDTQGYTFADGSWSLVEKGDPDMTSLQPAPWAVRDSRRDRMLIMLAGTVWELSLDTFVWTPLSPSGSPPPGWSDYSAIYDPTGDRVVFFGGTTSSGLIDQTWALELSGSPEWMQLAPSGTPPAARQGQAAVLDTLGDRMVVFGGSGTSGGLNDTWTLSLTGPLAWTQLATSGTAPPAAGATGVYDEDHHRMVVTSNVSSTPNVFTLSLGTTPTWSPAASVAGSPLKFYDGARHRALSLDAGIYSASYRALDLNTLQWSILTPSGRGLTAPIGAVFDRHRHRVVIFGDSYCTGLGNCTRYPYTFLWSFGPPAVDVEPAIGSGSPSALLSIGPSPARGSQTFTFRIGPGDEARALEVYSVDGRRVWSVALRGSSSGTRSWNGLGSNGGVVPAAVYFARLVTSRGTSMRRFVRL